jgi:(p)ppGpp synthase/HD superfamily hydrolase
MGMTPVEGRMAIHIRRRDVICHAWRHIAHLSNADRDVLLVSLADKVHNARGILRDLRKREVGSRVWTRFSQPKEKTIWYYRSLANKFGELLPGQLANELHEIVEVLEGE